MRKIAAELAWRLFIRSAYRWATQHMDQWEQVKFQTEHGTVYLTLSHQTPWPDAFETVDADGRAVKA